MRLDCAQKGTCDYPHLNAPYVCAMYGSCNVSSIARCITYSSKANTVLYVWKLHCAGRKTHRLTKSKISLVCIDGISLFFHLLWTRPLAWNHYKIWFAGLTDFWENHWFPYAQCLLGHAVYCISMLAKWSMEIDLFRKDYLGLKSWFCHHIPL